ncbi:GGDEF domain-containing protein [Kallotenue papyrolyticum]|uniref:GGDEF domain-containing protein n=1 Tax=Kallotenue papyrolyticum TaxID=1325125 RepID=UPI00047856F7|nr:GGDEF domain-containing protein [Kallotenue papyrolyticum]
MNHPTLKPWPAMMRLYWQMALVPAVWIPICIVYGGPVIIRATLAYWIGLALCYLARRRWPRPAVLVHLALAIGTSLYTLSSPPEQALRLAFAEWRLPVLAFTTVGLYALSAYGGKWAAALGLVMTALTPWPAWETRLLMVTAMLLAASAGLRFHQIMQRLAALQHQLEHQALTDGLTGLANRRALELDFPRYQAIADRERRPLWLSVWDLDGLKAINDAQGHAAGDRLIAEFAAVLRYELREGDGIYRIGGDEFCALHIGLRDGAALRERVRRRFANVSVGLAPTNHRSLEATLRAADAAMYSDKERRTAEGQRTRTPPQTPISA